MTAGNGKTACYHCGEDCGPRPVVFDDKPFCCQGCRTVYEILRDSNACEYYRIGEHPGVKLNTSGTGERYAYLDNPEIKGQLLEFADGGIEKVKFYVPYIHCSSCIWLLENLHRLNPAIVHSSVNFTRKEVSITYKAGDISLRKVVELLGSLNYTPHISLRDLENRQASKQNKVQLYKLGVAGFCFGNIMLFSFPEYLRMSHEPMEFMLFAFTWLNLAFSLPVVLYSASGYFVSAWKGLMHKMMNIDVPIALGIIALFVQSAREIIAGTGPGYMDSLAGLVFFMLVGKWYQGKTYQALSFERDYKSYFPVAVTKLDEEGREHSIALPRLAIGDRIIVRNLELIPADAIILKGNGNIDYSFVSGESAPVTKLQGERVFAGGRQKGSSLELMVEKAVEQSYLTELWNQDIHSEGSLSKLTPLVNRVSRYFTTVILIIAIGAAIFWMTADPSRALFAFTSVLIVTCPCALALTIPFTLGNTMRIFGRKGFYLKKTEVIEQLAYADTVVFDKTGTITRNDEFLVDESGIKLNEEETRMVRSLVRHSTHPMSQAVYHHLPDTALLPVDNFLEIPAEGIEGIAGGAEVKIGSQAFAAAEMTTGLPKASLVFVSINNVLKGYYTISNVYREGLEGVIGDLRTDHQLHLLSGDHDHEMPNLLPLFTGKDRLNFRQSPKDKLQYVQRLRQEGRKVLMIGDGLNDAGALSASNAGITIADDVYHFSPACDAILESSKFDALAKLLRFSKTSIRIVWISFIISFIYNVAGISFAVTGQLTPIIAAILMPVSSVSVVVFATLSTSLLARWRGL